MVRAGTRTNSEGARKNSGWERPKNGGAIVSDGGARPNCGKAWPDTGGERKTPEEPKNAGCARENTGDARAGAGRPLKNGVPEPDDEHTEEQQDHVPVDPVNSLVEEPQPKRAGYSSLIDAKRFRRAETSERGLFDVFYVWNPQAETVRYRQRWEGKKALPPHLQRVHDTRRTCSKSSDRIHNAGSCPHERWNLKMFNCKYSGAGFFRSEINGKCCGKRAIWMGSQI